jgi:hypothetical protein
VDKRELSSSSSQHFAGYFFKMHFHYARYFLELRAMNLLYQVYAKLVFRRHDKQAPKNACDAHCQHDQLIQKPFGGLSTFLRTEIPSRHFGNIVNKDVSHFEEAPKFLIDSMFNLGALPELLENAA